MKIILTGATGYVGEGVLLELLRTPQVEKVLSVSRRSVQINRYQTLTADEKALWPAACFFAELAMRRAALPNP